MKKFFPSTVIEWNSLGLNTKNSEQFNVFKRYFIAYNTTFDGHIQLSQSNGIKLIIRLSLSFSHHRSHKFRHNF